MKSRSLLLLFVGLMALFLFGCGSKEANSDAAPGVTPGTATAPGATGEAAPNKNAQKTGVPAPGMNPDYNSGIGTKAK